jgi:hypothetical protein
LANGNIVVCMSDEAEAKAMQAKAAVWALLLAEGAAITS